MIPGLKVAVLNGSPRGRYSTTLHSVLYLQKMYPEDTFTIVEVASRINSLKHDFLPVVEAVMAADIVLFAYPVYTFLAPSQLHWAIARLKSEGLSLNGKFATQITTSKHFYDVTAHRFVEDNVVDLGMTPIAGFSADMDDLLADRGRRQLMSFWGYVHFRICGPSQMPSLPSEGLSQVAIVTDNPDSDKLRDMIGKFRQSCPVPSKVVDISAFPFKGGCLGCFNCASDGVCIYRDGFSDFLSSQIHSACAIVYAFEIKDHSMGALFKMYDDRQFCNGHRMMTIGMPVGYIVAGNLDAEPNLRMLIEARAQVGGNFLCRTANDLCGVDALVEDLMYALAAKVDLPQNFYGVGGTRIFRDLIWLMRGLMKADHKFYKAHGIYDDLPHRHVGRMLKMKFIGVLFNNRTLRSKMGARLNEGMAAPYAKAVKDAKR